MDQTLTGKKRHLFYFGKQLEEGRTASDYTLQKGVHVASALRLRGGMPGLDDSQDDEMPAVGDADNVEPPAQRRRLEVPSLVANADTFPILNSPTLPPPTMNNPKQPTIH